MINSHSFFGNYIPVDSKFPSVNRIVKEAFDASRFGDNTFSQIDNMQFTDAQKMILKYALELEEQGFSDEEYYDLAYYFAEHNSFCKKQILEDIYLENMYVYEEID